MPNVHHTAVVHENASLAENVEVGPYAVIGERVSIGEGTVIGPHIRIEGPTTIGERNHFVGHGSFGTPPQDFKYKGEKTELHIGNDNMFREFMSINRGTVNGGGLTRIGSNNFFMAYTHVAHDCNVGSFTIFANGATLAGHVEVGDHATVGAFCAVHQFCRVGEHAFIGGGSIATQDVLPYIKTVGNRPAKTYGVNTIGLQRKGLNKETVEALQRAYRILTRGKMPMPDALDKIESDFAAFAEVRYMAEFIRASKRGVIR